MNNIFSVLSLIVMALAIALIARAVQQKNWKQAALVVVGIMVVITLLSFVLTLLAGSIAAG